MNKKKQINGMAQILYHNDRLGCEVVDAVEVANALYEAGYRKQSEDVVEVVRCKDCEHYRDWGNCITCMLWTVDSDVPTEPNAFCSYGTRKEQMGYPKRNGWISVEDKLPVEPGTYIVCTKKKDVAFDHFMYSFCDEVTHWMPLPEVPEN